MKALITGVTAFVGSTLADYLIDELGFEVHGIRKPRSREDFVRSDVTYHDGDITDQAAMSRIFRQVNPDTIFHLAAQSFVPLSWQAPQATMNANTIGSLNVLEAVYRECPNAVVQITGSSEEYGMVYEDECPINEQQPLRPRSPYGASKVAAEMLGVVYHQSYGLSVTLTRAFNHTGPRRGENFVTSKIAKTLAEIKLDLRKPEITLGNLDPVRDFTDVRDVVRGYHLLSQSGCFGTPYNLGSGVGRSIHEVLDTVKQISSVSPTVKSDPRFMRPAEVPRLICDASAFTAATGWKPVIPWEQTMEDLYKFWLDRLKKRDTA